VSILKRLGKSNSKGFTLIELLVVIAIIGVLATLVLLQLGVARAKARDAKRIADVSQLRTAVELYFDDNGGKYPVAISIATIGGYLSAPAVPMDPLVSTQAYCYAWNPLVGPTQFHLWSELERYNSAGFGADADINSSSTGPDGLWGGGAACRTNGGTASNEANPCTTADSSDCVYDQGQK